MNSDRRPARHWIGAVGGVSGHRPPQAEGRAIKTVGRSSAAPHQEG